MMRRIVAGHGTALDQAFELAEHLHPGSLRIELSSSDGYNFDLGALRAEHAPASAEVFVALDERAINYARRTLIAQVRLAGYRTYDLVSPVAHLERGVKVMGNVYVGAGCNVAAGCVLGMGSWLDRQVTLDRDVNLGSCVTLRAAAILGERVQIGSGSTMGAGAIAMPASQVGRHCEWLLCGPLPAKLEDGSFFDPLMPDGARILP